MHRTYQAVLNGNLIEWQEKVPPHQGTSRIEVTFVEEHPDSPELRKQAMLDALGALAASGVFKAIEDPIAWQKDIRTDHPLAGRQE